MTLAKANAGDGRSWAASSPLDPPARTTACEGQNGRCEQVWNLLRAQQQELCRQMHQLANDFAAADPALTRVSKLPMWVPFALAFANSFDMREALRVHARGICRAVDNETAKSPKDRTFAISVEVFLMQDTCHWF